MISWFDRRPNDRVAVSQDGELQMLLVGDVGPGDLVRLPAHYDARVTRVVRRFACCCPICARPCYRFALDDVVVAEVAECRNGCGFAWIPRGHPTASTPMKDAP